MSKYAGTTSLTQLQLTALAFIYILSGTSVLTFFHVNPWLGTFQVAATTSLLGNKMRSAHLERVPTAAIVLTIAVLVLISLRLLLTEELIMMAIFGGIDERVVAGLPLFYSSGAGLLFGFLLKKLAADPALKRLVTRLLLVALIVAASLASIGLVESAQDLMFQALSNNIGTEPAFLPNN